MLERTLSELYALPPSAFTRARNAKATALARAGRDAEARAVRQLRRPSAAVWAVNQLARLDPRRLAAFVATVDRVRRTQLGEPRAAIDAARHQRAELDALVDRAGELLVGQGQRATPVTRRQISDTLLGAAAHRGHAQALRDGRLTEALAAPGFEVLAGAARGRAGRLGGRPSAPARATERPAAHERERRRRETVELERRAAARQAEAGDLAREADALAHQLAAVRGRVREARRASQAAAVAARKARRASGRRGR